MKNEVIDENTPWSDDVYKYIGQQYSITLEQINDFLSELRKQIKDRDPSPLNFINAYESIITCYDGKCPAHNNK